MSSHQPDQEMHAVGSNNNNDKHGNSMSGSESKKKAMTQSEETFEMNKASNGFFLVDAWAFRAGCICFAFAILAAVVPQWKYVVPSATTFGLRTTCYGDRCYAIDFGLLQSTLNCGGKCSDAFEQFRLRWRAIEGFGWLGVVLFGLIAATLRIGYTRDIRPDALGAPHVVISITAILSVAMSVIIFGGSLNCGTGCFEYGASAICKLIAVACAVFCIPIGLVAVKCEGHRQTYGRLGFAVAVLGAAFEAAALLTSRWFYALKTPSSPLNATSVGLWMTCTDTSCGAIDLAAQLRPAQLDGQCSGPDADTLNARFTAGGVLLILGGVVSFALALVAYFEFGKTYYLRTILVFVALAFVTVGNSVVMATLDSWMYCDKTYCEVISRTGDSKTSCQPGASFAFGLCANLALGMVGLMEIINGLYHCCGVEETEGEGLLAAQQQIAAEKRERRKIRDAQRAEEEKEARAAAVAEESEARAAVESEEQQAWAVGVRGAASAQLRAIEQREAEQRREAAAAALRRAVAEREAADAAREAEEAAAAAAAAAVREAEEAAAAQKAKEEADAREAEEAAVAAAAALAAATAAAEAQQQQQQQQAEAASDSTESSDDNDDAAEPQEQPQSDAAANDNEAEQGKQSGSGSRQESELGEKPDGAPEEENAAE